MMDRRLAFALAAIAAVALGGTAAALALRTPEPLPDVPVRGDEAVVARGASAERAAPSTRVIQGRVRSEEGGGIRDALVCAHPAFDAAVVCETPFTSDGSFALTVPAGLHKLEVVPALGSRFVGEWHEDRDRSRHAELLDLRSADRDGLLVRLAAGRTVSGRVTLARGGAPSADAQVCASSTERPAEWICVRTDREGRYAVVLLPDRYLLFFVPPEGTRLIPRWWRAGDDLFAADVLDTRLGDASGIDVAFREGFLISGVVRGLGGKAIEHPFVCVDTPFPTGRICRRGDKDGRYSVAVRRGTFVVQFRAPLSERVVNEYHADAFDPRDADQVFVGGDLELDGSLGPGNLIWGQVRSREGDLPLEGATLNAYDATRPCCAFAGGTATSLGGDYGVVVPFGTYWLEAFPPTGTPYVSAFFGGSPIVAGARVIEIGPTTDIRVGGGDAVADVRLESFEAY